ncbi:MAG: site-specific integrase [Humidesulfovibrio sp.]|uniref:tyrosine-type recombinase/integrase n=1 Tax=Humidesulfovibrio sp. TaxID=2910988 RepID=UPI0027EA04C7|nr:site-specific integrase [Humidesulfovibrio sp.]MDQ7835335.1 site-specific integrase [Humidesulfovibrio sp.]
MAKGRMKTGYPGVYYYEQSRAGGSGTEKVFYIVFKQGGKVYEEPAGRQYRDNMTAAKASRIRADRIEGRKEAPGAARERKNAEKVAQANRPTIARLWEWYLEANPGLKGIVTDKNRFAKHLEPVFGQKLPTEIDPMSVDRFRVMMGKTHAPATVANALELLRRIVNFGVNRGLCDAPRFKIRLPKVDNLKTEDLSPEQLRSLLAALDAADNQAVADIMLMALHTGMRRGEILRLCWADLDFRTGFILIRTPKGGRSERIPMNPQARALLEGLVRTSDFVFPGRDGGQRVELRRAVRRICDAAGLPQDFRGLHGLRHAYASMLASSGEVDLYAIQKLLTHKSSAMTQRYAHLRDDALAKASAVAGRIVQQVQDMNCTGVPHSAIARHPAESTIKSG